MPRRSLALTLASQPAALAAETMRQSSDRLDPLIGMLVNGRYRVERAIGRGGMGRVYAAVQEPLGRPVALKVLRDDVAAARGTSSSDRLRVEADILSRLSHPNIVVIFDFGSIEGPLVGQQFIAMELLAGETLADRLATTTRLPPAEVLGIVTQILKGLRAAHTRRIVHRDLKPANVILVRDDVTGEDIVKLVDFGIGRVLDSEDELTGQGAFAGTPHYVAPEQLEGMAVPATDLYALGTLMFRALSGKLPFDGSSVNETVQRKRKVAAPRLRDAAPDLSVGPRLEALVASLLARLPEDRPAAAEVAREVDLCLAELVDGAPPTIQREEAASMRGASDGGGIVPARVRTQLTRRDFSSLAACALVGYAITLLFYFGHVGANLEGGTHAAAGENTTPPAPRASDAQRVPAARGAEPKTTTTLPASDVVPPRAAPEPRPPARRSAAPPPPPSTAPLRRATIFSTSP